MWVYSKFSQVIYNLIRDQVVDGASKIKGVVIELRACAGGHLRGKQTYCR
jgi:hypothetical protein